MNLFINKANNVKIHVAKAADKNFYKALNVSNSQTEKIKKK